LGFAMSGREASASEYWEIGKYIEAMCGYSFPNCMLWHFWHLMHDLTNYVRNDLMFTYRARSPWWWLYPRSYYSLEKNALHYINNCMLLCANPFQSAKLQNLTISSKDDLVQANQFLFLQNTSIWTSQNILILLG
jgi:hypothetical protein